MTNEQQRIAIAEACGWRWERQKIDGPIGRTTPQGVEGYNVLPDYLNSLDAIHEAEKHICRRGNNVAELLFNSLVSICGSEVDAAFATAAQRAEAWLKTKNLYTK